MNLSTIKSPGVYINEINAFPNSVVAVETAIPAFIGYTPQASYEGKSYTNVATKISSFAEFKAIYCFPDPDPPSPPAKQYKPEYYLIEQKEQPEKGNYVMVNNKYYSLVPDPSTIYYLYNSVKLFYDNGGGTAYIVSVGSYGTPGKKAMDDPGEQIINPNVSLGDLQGGLELLKNEIEPTMYICPEATLLSVDNNGTLMKAMLQQASEMQTAISIFDVIGGNDPDPLFYEKDIETFRSNTGTEGLDFGTAYYPFIGTTIMQSTDMDYTNLFGGDIKSLEPILNPPTNPDETVATIIADIENNTSGLTTTQYNNALITASTTYSSIMNNVLMGANILPPSGAMAGVITRTDNNEGPWFAPANTSITGAVSLPIKLSETQQGYLNVDAVSGKSVNAIRFFNGGLGILVWGARTLDGNSLDWKYISVRRTVTMIEQSCKLAAQSYVFAPNVKNTWESVKSMISSFLTTIWKQGGLMGATESDAFLVECGLGTTMTQQDILEGYMRVTVQVALVRPAEFIVLTFQQLMPQSS
ncbi:phage tail sheath C-terminal domain-containing protein [uncultured Winogradskyella sp.]|uniref:phage tail sheath family protein n=1 Tax=uncultured Winogradskyella sp. TaxID=395353 RepID=UPI00262A0E7D|nr:phage tail sheath C-terminal domain-containing protein [uncultured Winogradskyella sp.]